MKFNSIYYTHKPGGFCKRLYRLLNALSEKGYQVNYYCLDKPPPNLNPKIKWQKIPFPFKFRSGVLFWIVFSIWACVYLALFKTDKNARWIVFSPFYSCLLILTKLRHNCSIICFIRSKLASNSDYHLANLLDKYFARLCFFVSDKIVLQTEANKNLAIKSGCPSAKALVLKNDVSKIDFNQSDHSQLKFICAGVFNKKKNLGLLLKTWQILQQPDFLKTKVPGLTIVGQINQNNFKIENDYIKYIEWTENLDSELKNHSVLIHPSVHEGMPNTVLEALGAGLAVLLADTPELSELAGDSRLLFDPRNSDSLAQKIKLIAEDKSELNLIREISNKRAKELHFDWDQAAVSICVSS